MARVATSSPVSWNSSFLRRPIRADTARVELALNRRLQGNYTKVHQAKMSSVFQHAFRNAPKDKPKPHWLHSLLDRKATETLPQQPVESLETTGSGSGPNANKRNSHDGHFGAATPKESYGETQETKKPDESKAQPPTLDSRKVPDAALQPTRKHREPRDARAVPDQEQTRHHLYFWVYSCMVSNMPC